MDLVDAHRLLERRALVPLLEPVRVAPDVLGLVHDRGGLRRHLDLERVGVGLLDALAVGRGDLELVVNAGADLGDEQLPDPARAERAHRVQAAVPVVEVADHGDGLRGRRPDRERGARDALVLDHVRAEARVDLLVAALADEVQVDVAERRHEAVGVVDAVRRAVAVVDLELVVERQLRARHEALEQPIRVGGLELGDRLALHIDGDLARGRPDGADHDASLSGMGAPERVRVRGHVPPFDSSRRTMPAVGMATQSGRLLSS